MTVKVDKKSPWFDEKFQANEGPANSDDHFAQPDSTRGLRPYLERELSRRPSMYDHSTSETLAKGVHLRKQPNGTWELLVYRGRSTYDAYPVETREELLEFAKNFIQEP
jgi:hypothetical protein